MAAVVELMSSWLTPTTLFLLLNLMIGTIVITSRFGSSKKQQQQSGSDHYHYPHPPPLARATSSLIDRVKSINLSLYKFPAPSNPETEHFDFPGSDSNLNPVALARAPSLLGRVKSINFSNFKFPLYNPGNDYNQQEYDPTRVDPVESNNFSQFKTSDYDGENDSSQEREPEKPSPANPTRLVRAPSLLERVKSINFPSFYGQIAEPSQPRSDPDPISGSVRKTGEEKLKRSKPQTTKKKTTAGKDKMTKSASEKTKSRVKETTEEVEMRRPETSRVERSTSFGDGEDSVDAKASDFISKFKQQLKLQRLDSILRNKEMLKAN